MKNQRFLIWLLLFFILLSVFQNLGKNGGDLLNENDIGVATDRTSYKEGKTITLTIQNNTENPLNFIDTCPEIPFEVLKYNNGEWTALSEKESCDPTGENKTLPQELAPGEKQSFSYQNWSYRLFGDLGRYRIDVPMEEEGTLKTFSSNEFTVEPRGLLGQFWMTIVYRPILNTLVFLIESMPRHSLGLAIILLTLIIRTLLLIPSQRAMRSQRKMQEIQPKLEELKKRHKDNQEKLALETMKLWQSQKVNPFGSCLMILVQFPILIALYYVVQSGLHPDKVGLLYDFVASDLDFTAIQTNFLGLLELTEIDFFVLPLTVGGLQYFQMHLALARAQKKKEKAKQKKGETKILKKVEGTEDLQDQMQMATNMMKYVMPVMIAFFTASLPAGVGLYWGVSTIYGIVQQIVVNKESLKEKEDNEPVVRVIEK